MIPEGALRQAVAEIVYEQDPVWRDRLIENLLNAEVGVLPSYLDCVACGIWVCGKCGTARRGAFRFRDQRCQVVVPARCGGTRGYWRSVRHYNGAIEQVHERLRAEWIAAHTSKVEAE